MRKTEVFYYIVNNSFQQSFSNCQNVCVCMYLRTSVLGSPWDSYQQKEIKEKEKEKKVYTPWKI